MFYVLLLAPMALIAWSASLGAKAFVLLALYCSVYQPTLVGLRLLDKHVINKADFAKTYTLF